MSRSAILRERRRDIVCTCTRAAECWPRGRTNALGHQSLRSFDPGQPPARAADARIPTPIGACRTWADPNLDNVIFVGGRAVALIDFDLAAPGSEVWDVACAARLWAPLRAEADVAPELRGRALERLALFADAYGLPARDRTRLVEALLSTHVWCYGIVYSEVRRGHETFGHVWADGGRGRALRRRSWIAAHQREMQEALTGALETPR
jgi:Phosphotransferase enzyme family